MSYVRETKLNSVFFISNKSIIKQIIEMQALKLIAKQMLPNMQQPNGGDFNASSSNVQPIS